MADYNAMKDKLRREGQGEQALKFMEMMNPAAQMLQMGQSSAPVDFSTPNPLAGLPVNPAAKASLDADYAKVDQLLAEREAALARIPTPSADLSGRREYADKYGYGAMASNPEDARRAGLMMAEGKSSAERRAAYDRTMGPDYDPEAINDTDYQKLLEMEKRGLIQMSPDFRAEVDRARSRAKQAHKAQMEASAKEAEAAKVSPMNQAGGYRLSGQYDWEDRTAALRRPSE